MKPIDLYEGKKRESGPTGFKNIYDLGVQTFRTYNITIKLKNLIDNLDYIQTYNITSAKNKTDAVNVALKEYNKDLRSANIISKNLKLDQVEYEVEDNPQTQIANYLQRDIGSAQIAKRIRANNIITVGNIKRIVDSGVASNDRRKPAFAQVLDTFITDPGQKKFPLTVLNDVSALKKVYGFDKYKDIVNDFGEIMGPVGLICDTVNGNGSRLIQKLFNADTASLMKDATIHFQPARNFPLVDSYIEYNGKILNISSKANGGAGASLAGLPEQLKFIKENPDVKRLYDAEIAKNPAYQEAERILNILVKEEDAKGGWRGFIDTAIALLPNKGIDIGKGQLPIGITKSDKNTLYAVANYVGGTETGLSKANSILKALVSGTAEQETATLQKVAAKTRTQVQPFSKNFKNIFYFNPTMTKQQGSEAGKDSVWLQFKKAIVWHITTMINKNEAFSNLLTWIFNHGAIVQITTVTSYLDTKTAGFPVGQTNKGADPLVYFQIKATWPSSAIDTVELVEAGQSPGFFYRLRVNGRDIQLGKPMSSDLGLSEPDIGFEKDAEELEKLNPKSREYAKKAKELQQKRSELDQARTRTAQDQIYGPDDWFDQGVYKTNKGVGDTESVSLVFSKEKPTQVAALGKTDAELIAAKVPKNILSQIQKERANIWNLAFNPADKKILLQKIKNHQDRMKWASLEKRLADTNVYIKDDYEVIGANLFQKLAKDASLESKKRFEQLKQNVDSYSNNKSVERNLNVKQVDSTAQQAKNKSPQEWSAPKIKKSNKATIAAELRNPNSPIKQYYDQLTGFKKAQFSGWLENKLDTGTSWEYIVKKLRATPPSTWQSVMEQGFLK